MDAAPGGRSLHLAVSGAFIRSWMKASVARTIKAFLRNHLRLLSFPGLTPGFGREPAPLAVAQIALSQDRGDLRDHLIERVGDGRVGRGTPRGFS